MKTKKTASYYKKIFRRYLKRLIRAEKEHLVNMKLWRDASKRKFSDLS